MLLLALFLSVQAGPSCLSETSDYLALDFHAFDQGDEGWRQLAQAECEVEAADLIGLYHTAHSEALYDGQVSKLEWHEGQLRAAIGDTHAAIRLFRETLDTAEHGEADYFYTLGTIAFLEGDLSELQSHRDSLAALPEPDGFDEAIERFQENYPDYPVPTWPTNLDVLDGFLNCFGEPYRVAYSYECRTIRD